MVDAIIKGPQELRGEVSAPPSKAYTHRVLIAALLSNGFSKILNPLVAEDTEATLRAITALGAKADLQRDLWRIEGATSIATPPIQIHCGESGSTLRFVLPVSALAQGPSAFTMGPSLARRPLMPLLQSLKQLGVESNFRSDNETPVVEIRGGGIKGGRVTIVGDVSSQFISGLLFGCPKAETDTDIFITTPLESKDYVKMTIEILARHGIRVFTCDEMAHLKIPSNQTYSGCDHQIPGDFSSAAFLLAAAAVTHSKLKVKDLNCRTTQGDKKIVNLLEEAGSKVESAEDFVEIEGKELCAIRVDAKEIPDLVPICAVLACYSEGISRMCNARRLKYKESDRLSSLQAELSKMGGKILMNEDSLIVTGPCKMQGARIDPHKDHRIAMACAIAALAADGETVIQNCECVNKSYPRFFEDLRLLGADVDVCR